jgi:hypothetical protein
VTSRCGRGRGTKKTKAIHRTAQYVTSRCGWGKGTKKTKAIHRTAQYVTSRCGRAGEQRKQKSSVVAWKTKAIRRGVCYYSVVLNVHRVTSMADTDIDDVRKQKKTRRTVVMRIGYIY